MRSSVFVFFIIAIVSCNRFNTKSPIKNTVIDTLKSFKVGSSWITPKKFFDYNTVVKLTGDTLDIVGCGEYIYSPFGAINKKSDLERSILKKFVIGTRIDTSNQHYVYQVITHKSSKLKFFFYDEKETSKASFITEGEILDADVPFALDIAVEMKQKDFVHVFFDHFPEELVMKFKVIVFESCVESIKHIYTFENGELKSVRFVSA